MRKTRNYLNRDFKRERKIDSLTKKKRSGLMSKIHSRGTKFEREFISALEKVTSKKFITNVVSIRGKPDIVFEKNKVCIFLDSDFWHGWYYPKWKHLLKNDFWREKIEKNRSRDKSNTSYLRSRNWKVLRIWEHEIKKSLPAIVSKIGKLIEK